MSDINPGKTVSLCVMSGKGGVGKTNLSLNLGYALRDMGHKLLLMAHSDKAMREMGRLLAQAPRSGVDQTAAAYERLLLDLIEGDQTLFVRRDEVEAQWTWIDAIREGWKANDMKPKHYTAGTWGPAAAVSLIERHGHSWRE